MLPPRRAPPPAASPQPAGARPPRAAGAPPQAVVPRRAAHRSRQQTGQQKTWPRRARFLPPPPPFTPDDKRGTRVCWGAGRGRGCASVDENGTDKRKRQHQHRSGSPSTGCTRHGGVGRWAGGTTAVTNWRDDGRESYRLGAQPAQKHRRAQSPRTFRKHVVNPNWVLLLYLNWPVYIHSNSFPGIELRPPSRAALQSWNTNTRAVGSWSGARPLRARRRPCSRRCSIDPPPPALRHLH